MRGEQERREVDICGIERQQPRLTRRGRRAGRHTGLAVTIRDLASRDIAAGAGNRRSSEQTTADQELPPIEAKGRLATHTEGSLTAPVAAVRRPSDDHACPAASTLGVSVSGVMAEPSGAAC
jgi:hypothetical protein